MTGSNKKTYFPCQIATKISQETYDWLIERAEKGNMSKAMYVRNIIENFRKVIIANE